MATFSDSYEVGFAAETGWRKKTETDNTPPWEYVQDVLEQRISNICRDAKADTYCIYLSEGKSFRNEIAQKKPYKGQRKDNKPYHFNNLSVYIKDVLGAKVATFLEADDLMAIDHINSQGNTIICSRDKDLRTVPGMHYTWENGRQASFGPELITKEGWIKLSDKHDKIVGTGLAFFYSQVLTGDTVDNIGGLPDCGPVKAYELLRDRNNEQQLESICSAYREVYGEQWQSEITEQGKLTWLVRKLDQNGMPITWEVGMTE